MINKFLIGYGIGLFGVSLFDIIIYGMTDKFMTMLLGETFVLWGLLE